ncbi:protein LATERAL ORGAN BOUNDARIES-like [Humulus lupulus]|uniref:protein LATERAL ORGAN BOUNDARIES-like n=1 Tax=Humulus lupulus TaxID=3486 RepID=UPI002B4177D2|nr:protein LATERAL ORGAN BOUNDARIES-like [Humulus lupulus]
MNIPPPPPPPCAACKFLRRKCMPGCIFAPYFPSDQPQKFASVHRIYGTGNVAKILNGINVAHREEAVNSLAYEAQARLRDPVYGVIGFISILHNHLNHARARLNNASNDLGGHTSPHPQPQSQKIINPPPNGVPPMPNLEVNPNHQQQRQQPQPQLRPFCFENIPRPQHPQQQMISNITFDYIGEGGPFGPMVNPDMMEHYNSQMLMAGSIFNRGGGGGSSSVAATDGACESNNNNTNLNGQLMQLNQIDALHDSSLDHQLQSQLMLNSPNNNDEN